MVSPELLWVSGVFLGFDDAAVAAPRIISRQNDSSKTLSFAKLMAQARRVGVVGRVEPEVLLATCSSNSIRLWSCSIDNGDSASSPASVQISRLEQCKAFNPFDGADGDVSGMSCCCWSKNGETIASASKDGRAAVTQVMTATSEFLPTGICALLFIV